MIDRIKTIVPHQGTIITSTPYGLLAFASQREKARAPHIPYDWKWQYSTKLHLWPKQELRFWAFGYHCGERIQGGEVKERSGVVCGLGREVDMER